MKTLIIEDSPADQKIISQHLLKAYPNVNLVCASSGYEGLDYIQNDKFCCIFIDYNLPDISGLEILQQIYSPLTDLPPYPCIMLTGDDNLDIVMEAMTLGAQDYVLKSQMSSEMLFLTCEKAGYLFNIKSEKHEISKKYAHTQKLEAIGQLTGGIAHDFNNLLTVILGNSKLMNDQVSGQNFDADYFHNKLNSIQNAAQKGADLVQHLMSFSRTRELKPKPVIINGIIKNMHDLLTRTIGKTVEIEYNFSPALWATNIDPSELEHLVINLCANARDAMPDGGNITIETRNISSDNLPHCITQGKGKNYVRMSVSDTGSGIPPEYMDRIFDPFFTTKDVGKGTGLGLSTCFSFVDRCGGAIDVSSTPGQGTRFDIYFRQHHTDGLLPQQKPESSRTLSKIQDLTILVVEDDDDIRELALMILQAEGYKTIEAADGHDALNILQQKSDQIDLLFTDIVMPGEINGIQLAARALVLKPDLNILFTTGFIKNRIPDINLLEQYDLLNKPYTPEQLSANIRRVTQSQ